MRGENGKKVYYSNFELLLSDHIVQYIHNVQRKFPSSRDLGSLDGENAIEKLRNFTRGNKTQSWRLVADACTNFVEKFGYTHYVYSITLGKLVTKEKQEEERKKEIEGKAEAKVPIKAANVEAGN